LPGQVVAPADDRSARRARICSSGQSKAEQKNGEDANERGSDLRNYTRSCERSRYTENSEIGPDTRSAIDLAETHDSPQDIFRLIQRIDRPLSAVNQIRLWRVPPTLHIHATHEQYGHRKKAAQFNGIGKASWQ
jgi:hypothetical protein